MRCADLPETLRQLVEQIGVSTLACRIGANRRDQCAGSARADVDPSTPFIPPDFHIVEMNCLSRLFPHRCTFRLWGDGESRTSLGCTLEGSPSTPPVLRKEGRIRNDLPFAPLRSVLRSPGALIPFREGGQPCLIRAPLSRQIVQSDPVRHFLRHCGHEGEDVAHGPGTENPRTVIQHRVDWPDGPGFEVAAYQWSTVVFAEPEHVGDIDQPLHGYDGAVASSKPFRCVGRRPERRSTC